MTEETKRISATIKGRVQGVMYRGTTMQEARKLKLTGWVRNNPNGSVSTIAEGPEPALQAFIEYLHSGPPAARVTAVEVTWQKATAEFRNFSVRY